MRILTRIITLFFIGSLLFLAGCDGLNLEPKDEFQADQVFEDPALTRSYLNEIYSHTGLGYGDPMPTPGIVDEALNTHDHPGSQNIMSSLTPGDRGQWDSPGNWTPDGAPYEAYDWGSVYSFVRDLNLFIENVEGNEVIPSEDRETLLGEAYFLRGYFYHNLMKLYGGVPTLHGVFELGEGEEQYQVERSTFTHTVNSIVSDLDEAADRLDMEPRQQGSATEAAAHALKSRVLLFAASDLYHDSPFDSKTEYVTYSSSDTTRRQLWEGVVDAADAVESLGFELGEDLSVDEYHELFTQDNPNAIWTRYFDQNSGFAHNQSQWVSPNGYFSWSGDTPTQEHVDAYEMADGSDFQWEGADPTPTNPEEPEPDRDPVDADNPYDDRDPRFYANIHFNGAEWRQRPSGAPRSTDPVGVIQTGEYEMQDEEEEGTVMVSGLDTDAGPQSWNTSRTGYNIRKFVDRNVRPDQEQSYNPWIHIRYAEVLLNKAEAEANLGNLGPAQDAIDEVRSRVGMPDVTASSEADLLEQIRQEREVELAFEGHRYFDVRRWKMGEEAYRDVHGISITGYLEGSPDSDLTLGELIAQDSYNYFFKVVHRQEREWQDKNYFLPFSNEEVNRNPNLEEAQNPGY